VKRVALLIGVVLLLAACGGGGGNSEADQVKQAWTSFFSAKTPVSQKITLLQDGARFKAAITNLASNALASQLNAKVSRVTLQGANTAKVVYTINLGKTPVLPNVVGYAYQQNGKWVVGYAGLCKLIALQPGVTLPAACKS
jgi:ABC-type glycerol-3-phosphate transport system substrate-binding protein